MGKSRERVDCPRWITKKLMDWSGVKKSGTGTNLHKLRQSSGSSSGWMCSSGLSAGRGDLVIAVELPSLLISSLGSRQA
jgi:hypothetical protein